MGVWCSRRLREPGAPVFLGALRLENVSLRSRMLAERHFAQVAIMRTRRLP
jgi:hypothetical protein